MVRLLFVEADLAALFFLVRRWRKRDPLVDAFLVWRDFGEAWERLVNRLERQRIDWPLDCAQEVGRLERLEEPREGAKIALRTGEPS